MKKYINKYEDMIEEMLGGFVTANGRVVKRLGERVIAGMDTPKTGKVGVSTGGGSGHKPAFIGYIGDGMLDTVAVGNIFAAPGAEAWYEAMKACDGGEGVLLCIGNYSGDIMNSSAAADMLREDGVEVETVIVNDDVASAPKNRMDNRRGVAGEIILWKIVGAMAEQGADLKHLKEVGDRVVYNTRSLGVAHTSCIMPSSGKPSFEISDTEMEIGVGHHGEPGIDRIPMMSADETTELLMEKILEDLPFERGNDVSVIVNGLGSTALNELYIITRRVDEILKDKGINAFSWWVGDFFTSMEMGGYSITLTKLDEDIKKAVEHPANAVHFRV